MSGVNYIERLESPGRSATEQRNMTTVQTVFQGLARADFRVLYSHMAPNASFWVLGLTPEKLESHGLNPNFIAELFPDGLQFDILEAVAEGNSVAVEWKDEAITKGGLTYENNGVSLFTFDDEGRIVNYREYIDPDKFYAILK